jgi:hypothetical protein
MRHESNSSSCMSVDRHRDDLLGHDLGIRVLVRDPGIHDRVVVRRFAVGTVAVAVLAFVGCRVGILDIHHDHDHDLVIDSPDSPIAASLSLSASKSTATLKTTSSRRLLVVLLLLLLLIGKNPGL